MLKDWKDEPSIADFWMMQLYNALTWPHCWQYVAIKLITQFIPLATTVILEFPTWSPSLLVATQVYTTPVILAITVMVSPCCDWLDQYQVIMLPVVWSVWHIRVTSWLSHTVSTPICGDDVMVTLVSTGQHIRHLTRIALPQGQSCSYLLHLYKRTRVNAHRYHFTYLLQKL